MVVQVISNICLVGQILQAQVEQLRETNRWNQIVAYSQQSRIMKTLGQGSEWDDVTPVQWLSTPPGGQPPLSRSPYMKLEPDSHPSAHPIILPNSHTHQQTQDNAGASSVITSGERAREKHRKRCRESYRARMGAKKVKASTAPDIQQLTDADDG